MTPKARAKGANAARAANAANACGALALLGVALLGVRGARAADEVGAELVTIAHSGVRPEECGGASRLRAGRWERAKTPGLGRYCDLLARGYSALSASPDRALRDAKEADGVLPGHAAPLLLSARAEGRSGALTEAWGHFERARALSPKSLEAPAALRDFAVAALATGHDAEARTAYRALVPRAALVGDRTVELSIFVEAAVLVMQEGNASLPEAIGYLTEARRRGTLPGIGDGVLAALALALDRAGRATEAVAVAADVPGPTWLEAGRSARASGKASSLPALPGSEIDAMIAIVAERSDQALALDRWQSYLASDAGKSGPFAAHARAHRDALGRRKGPPSSAPAHQRPAHHGPP